MKEEVTWVHAEELRLVPELCARCELLCASLCVCVCVGGGGGGTGGCEDRTGVVVVGGGGCCCQVPPSAVYI